MFVIPVNGGIHFNLHDPADTRIDSQAKVTDDKWHYCVMTVEKGTLRAYIDGNKEETQCGEPEFSLADVTIGAGGNGNQFWMMGAIDEPAIFNRALDEAEIKKFINGGLGGRFSVDANGKLAASWGRIKAKS